MAFQEGFHPGFKDGDASGGGSGGGSCDCVMMLNYDIDAVDRSAGDIKAAVDAGIPVFMTSRTDEPYATTIYMLTSLAYLTESDLWEFVFMSYGNDQPVDITLDAPDLDSRPSLTVS